MSDDPKQDAPADDSAAEQYEPGEPSPLDAEGYETDAAGTYTG